MPERVPSLDVVRPVLNIGHEEVSRVEERFLEETNGSPAAQDIIGRLFRPVDAFRATLVSNREFVRLQRHFYGGLAEGDVQKLAGHLHEVLPTSAQTVDLPTFPLRFYDVDRASRRTMTIAGGPQILGERQVTQEAILSFMDVDAEEVASKGVWDSDPEKTSRVWLATSRGKVQTALLRKLGEIIGEEPDLLPAVTEFGPMKIRRST